MPIKTDFSIITKELDEDQYRPLIQKLEDLKLQKKDYSDVKSLDQSGDTLQWVNFVQEGGGTLGFALVGYAFVLEYVGIRFMRLAGTSAGAINTLFLAAIGEKWEPKTPELFEMLLDNKRFNLKSFVDTENGLIKRLIFSLSKGLGLVKNVLINYLVLLILSLIILPFINSIGISYNAIYLIFLVIFCAITLYIVYLLIRLSKYNFGINPGKKFEDVLIKELENYGIKNQDNLNKKAIKKFTLEEIHHLEDHFSNLKKNTIDSGQLYLNVSTDENKIPAVIVDTDIDKNQNAFKNISKNLNEITSDYLFVSTDINNEQKIIFPTEADLYFGNPGKVNPATYVRASMAIPLFFEPKMITIKYEENDNLKNLWIHRKGVPTPKDKGIFIDGGTLSNFPINLFHQPYIKNPRLPVMGVKILDSLPHDNKSPIKKFSFGYYLEMVINTLRNNEDNSFLAINPFYNRFCIGEIKAYETKINWLNFNLSKEEKLLLFTKGMEAAISHLNKFDWKKYKLERSKI